MNIERSIEDSIDKAATTVGSAWPAHSLVTTNPFSGFEDMPSNEAVMQAADFVGGRGYPSPETSEATLEGGQIDPAALDAESADRGYDGDPEVLLERMDAGVEPAGAGDDVKTDAVRVDRVLAKWLSVFFDGDQVHWPMPDHEDGFYGAFRSMAAYDDQIPDDGIVSDLPGSPIETIGAAVMSYLESQWVPILEKQLAALPGWTGFIKQRAADGGEWQSAHPISLDGYLAARLVLLDAFGVDIAPSIGSKSDEAEVVDELADAFLSAWEASYRDEAIDRVAAESEALDTSDATGRPDAQLVLCIDTRPEVIRQHIETTGDYETHGCVGFFGIPTEYRGYDTEAAVDACPPIADPQYRVTEVPTDRDTEAIRDRWPRLREAVGEAIESSKINPATAFGSIEGVGSGYGLTLAVRTLVPGRASNLLGIADDAIPDDCEFCDQVIHHQHSYAGDLPVGLTDDEKVEYAANAFGLMGWEEFGRLAMFTGHASETANNPCDSGLDCGVCAGHPGGPNTRVPAAICNDETVKAQLRDCGFGIPEDTVFIAGEHNMMTDGIELYNGDVPESHAENFDQLRADLAVAREHAAVEHAETMGAGGSAAVSKTEHRAADWAEARPERGLAGNAGFITGPRELTSDLDLDGRAFLYSYDHATNPDSDALEAILTGPMVVTQWVNAQYYFSTVDNVVYGNGSKVTQNPVGNVGVYQGNSGDLTTGLPFQSLMADDDTLYHQPLHLSTIIYALVDRVTDVLADHAELTGLLDNDWLSLTAVDPTQDHRAFHYDEELMWAPASERVESNPEPKAPGTPATTAVADD